METQVSGSEIELVVDTTTTTTTSTVYSHADSFSNHQHSTSFTTLLISVLTKFHAGYFRISLSLGSQALLWKTVITSTHDTTTLPRVLSTLPSAAVSALWSLSLLILLFLSLIYLLRCFFFFKMVKAEFLHPVGVNYLFAPWISWLLLLQSAPFVAPKTTLYFVLWWVFAAPMVVLDVKIYGQWLTKGKRVLSSAAGNPTSQMSVIGNLVGAHAAAHMGWKECAMWLFSVGMVHYLVLFVTLYQRLSGRDGVPVLLRPVLFLFIAAPSFASLAWESIVGTFDTASKMLFFLSLFLFASLFSGDLSLRFVLQVMTKLTAGYLVICRPSLFRRSMRRFNVTWWAYSFPITALALVSMDYAEQVKGTFSHILMLLLLTLSVLVSFALTLFTLLNSNMFLPLQPSVLAPPSYDAI